MDIHSEIILETKLVGSISGKFIVPSYQRGYRWGPKEVTRLLDDIKANDIEASEPEETSVVVEAVSLPPVTEAEGTDVEETLTDEPISNEEPISEEVEIEDLADEEKEEQTEEEPEEIIDETLPEEEEGESDSETCGAEYVLGTFATFKLDETPMGVPEFCSKESQSVLEDKILQLIENEAPITKGDLTKKLVRSCGIGRITPATEEWTEKLVKKLKIKSNKLNGLKSYWRDDQDPADYRVFRAPATDSDRRELYDMVMQEKKNAVCLALISRGPLDKDSLIKEVSRMMGWMRLSDYMRGEIFEAIKYAKRVDAITINEDKQYCISK